MDEAQIRQLVGELGHLSPSQVGWVRAVAKQFLLPHRFQQLPTSDWITERVVESLGDTLRIHHAFSRQALSKDRFEYAFERALVSGGHVAQIGKSRTNRGHDLTVNGVPISLKTEAATAIRPNKIHVSKWCELGKGEWELPLLLAQFLQHLSGYDRIFTLRSLLPGPTSYRYELVEIPKALLLEAEAAELIVMETSTQSLKPGYGYIRDACQQVKFALYFDGGGERKLQVKHLDKNLCTVHATWEFQSATL